MTDGYASYPTKGIQRLKELQTNNPGKFNYAGI